MTLLKRNSDGFQNSVYYCSMLFDFNYFKEALMKKTKKATTPTTVRANTMKKLGVLKI